MYICLCAKTDRTRILKPSPFTQDVRVPAELGAPSKPAVRTQQHILLAGSDAELAERLRHQARGAPVPPIPHPAAVSACLRLPPPLSTIRPAPTRPAPSRRCDSTHLCCADDAGALLLKRWRVAWRPCELCVRAFAACALDPVPFPASADLGGAWPVQDKSTMI